MGCTSSKQARHDMLRSTSLPVRRGVRPKIAAGGDEHHIVALTSSTLGSLRLDRDLPADRCCSCCSPDEEEAMKTSNDRLCPHKSELATRAKAWSEMIGRRFPKTPSVTPPHEPETINAWELMEGLEDLSPPRTPPSAALDRSFSFSSARDSAPNSRLTPNGNGNATPKEGSIMFDFDPEIMSTFRKALDELSPQHPILLRSPEPEKTVLSQPNPLRDIPKFTGIVKARISAFQEKIDARKALSNGGTAKVVPSCKCPPGCEGKAVFYFTSLRGVRKTYEDCWEVRIILKGYSVRVDERDVSMHGGFKEELSEILGPGYGGNQLPRVFVDGKYLGGAEEVRQMHEAGELGSALEGCEIVAVGKGDIGVPCEGCGDMRFVPCETCSGSCKVFVEEEEEEAEGEGVGGFQRCPDCNENGLIRCPLCCSS